MLPNGQTVSVPICHGFDALGACLATSSTTAKNAVFWAVLPVTNVTTFPHTTVYLLFKDFIPLQYPLYTP
jgi:hypothetical protein